MKIKLSSVFVEDQDKALSFYTEVLGFVKKMDSPLGEAKWLTVVSPEEPEGTELLMEPNGNPIAQAYQKGLFTSGIPAAAFFVDDIHQEYKRLLDLEVRFISPPTQSGPVWQAVFDDTCGNLIQIYQA